MTEWPPSSLLRLSQRGSQLQGPAWGGMGLGDRSHYTWVLTGGKGSAMLSGPRGNRGGDGSERRRSEEEWGSFHQALSWVTGCDTDGAYQHTWAWVHIDRGGKSTTGMWRGDPAPGILFTHDFNCRIGFTTLLKCHKSWWHEIHSVHNHKVFHRKKKNHKSFF